MDDFPCFLCGSTGPHMRILPPRHPQMTEAEWEQQSYPALIQCGSCSMTIWEPDTGDGSTAPNLTVIRPELRDLAHQALDEGNLSRFFILADGHCRGLLMNDNAVYFHSRGLWDDVHLAQLRLIQPD